MFWFTDYGIIAGNMGVLHANAEIILDVIIALLFGININLLYMKIKLSSFTKRATGASAVGAFFGILIGGCPSCSITVASYLGLAGILGAFAYSGLLLKSLSVLLILYSSWYLLKTLTTCTSAQEKTS